MTETRWQPQAENVGVSLSVDRVSHSYGSLQALRGLITLEQYRRFFVEPLNRSVGGFST